MIMFKLRSRERHSLILLLLSCLVWAASAGEVTLKLSNGDRISGTVLSRNTNHVVLSNTWASEITIPLARIESGLTNKFSDETTQSTEIVVFSPITPVAASIPKIKTNGWQGEAQVGLDLNFGARDRRVVYGRFKLGYQRPYDSDSRKFFRNLFDYSIDYGTTETIVEHDDGSTERQVETTSDRMQASDKLSFDLMGQWYIYSLVGGGYDHILRVEAQYEAGPGFGYHLINRPEALLNVEAGVNYQAQFRSDGSELQDVYYRLAQELQWRMFGKLSLVERLEYFPRVNLTGQRLRSLPLRLS